MICLIAGIRELPSSVQFRYDTSTTISGRTQCTRDSTSGVQFDSKSLSVRRLSTKPAAHDRKCQQQNAGDCEGSEGELVHLRARWSRAILLRRF
jgi:hypothetical protein